MAGNNGRGRTKFAATPQGSKQALGFFSSIDATTEHVDRWDVKDELLARVVLTALGRGYNIGFYSAWHGEAINVWISRGDAKDTKGVRDSLEFDLVLRTIWEQFEQERARLEKLAE